MFYITHAHESIHPHCWCYDLFVFIWSFRLLVLGVGHYWGFVCFSIGVHYIDFYIPSFIRMVVMYCTCCFGNCFHLQWVQAFGHHLGLFAQWVPNNWFLISYHSTISKGFVTGSNFADAMGPTPLGPLRGAHRQGADFHAKVQLQRDSFHL